MLENNTERIGKKAPVTQIERKHELNQSDSHLPRVLCQKISADNLLVIFFH